MAGSRFIYFCRGFNPSLNAYCCFSYQSFSCSRYMLVRELFLYLQQIIVCGESKVDREKYMPWKISVILTLRVYALYGRSRRLLSYIVIIGVALMGGASVRIRISFCTLNFADLFRRVLLEIIQILRFTSKEVTVITHSQQRRMSFPSSVCVPAQKSRQSHASVNSQPRCMQVDDATTLSTCRLWTGLDCSFCLRITYLCPYSLQGLQD